MPNKVFTLFAGVNGAGKSTLYDNLDLPNLGIRINSDEIAKGLGDFNSRKIQIQAGRIAVKQIKQCIVDGICFNQETTLAGKWMLKQLELLKANGYYINLHYIGLESVTLAISRVIQRVREGGHNVPVELIKKRFVDSRNNLVLCLDYIDSITLYDNSGNFRRICLKYSDNKMLFLANNMPEWCKPVLVKLNGCNKLNTFYENQHFCNLHLEN